MKMATNPNIDAATAELLESLAISAVERRWGFSISDDVASIFSQCRAITAPENFRAAVEDGLMETLNLVEDMEEHGRNSDLYHRVKEIWLEGCWLGR